MHVLVAYSQPRGKYGRYVFTVMIHFAEETEVTEISVMRPQQQTQTVTKYSCDHCGRWASIVTHQQVNVTTPLQPVKHQRDGKLELYRYDNVDPKDWIEIILRDSKMWAYQLINIDIKKEGVSLQNYWRYTNNDQRYQVETVETVNNATKKGENPDRATYFSQKRRTNCLHEPEMEEEILYDVNLLQWDEYVTTRTQDMGDIRVEEELIKQTMNAEPITITELLLEPARSTPAIEGAKGFIEGTLRLP